MVDSMIAIQWDEWLQHEVPRAVTICPLFIEFSIFQIILFFLYMFKLLLHFAIVLTL